MGRGLHVPLHACVGHRATLLAEVTCWPHGFFSYPEFIKVSSYVKLGVFNKQ